MPSGITIYGDDTVAETLASVTAEFPELWGDRGTTAKIPKERYMLIPLVPDWQDKLLPPKTYNLGRRDREVVDKLCDGLHS